MVDGGVTEALSALFDCDPDAADHGELARIVRSARVVRGFLDALDVRVARRSRHLAESAGASPAASAGTAAMVLGDLGRRSPKDVKAAVARAAACSVMPSMESALAAGKVSAGHVDAVAAAARRLDDAGRSELAATEADLVVFAQCEPVSAFERRVRDVATRIMARDGGDVAELQCHRDASRIRRWIDESTGMHCTLFELDAIRDAELWTVLDAHVAASKQDDSAGRPFDELVVDAVLSAITVSGTQPTRRVPEVSVLVDLDTLLHGLHEHSVCELSNGNPIPAATVRRMAREATIVPIVLDGDGLALDHGRARRTASADQRRALRAMHRTCAHPHCAVAFERCRIHHLRHWTAGGSTDLDNLIPLCTRHHHDVHEGNWTLSMAPDRIITLTRPDGTTHYCGPSIDGTRPGRSRGGRERPG
jgi:hypothetical protein